VGEDAHGEAEVLNRKVLKKCAVWDGWVVEFG
jgi:hypothetical protein